MLDGRLFLNDRDLLYSDTVGKDACGIGGIATNDGKPCRELVDRALIALKAMEHRGGICGAIGDGAGLTVQFPKAFFFEEAVRIAGTRLNLTEEDTLAVGVFFLSERHPETLDRSRKLIEEILTRDGFAEIVGWRPVPFDPLAIPKEALDGAPTIDHLILRIAPSRVGKKGTIAEKELYNRRLAIRQAATLSDFGIYVPSLSTKLVSYKGLFTSHQLADFYLDLAHPRFEVGIAIFHRRYSTNTYPNWSLAQPFRFGCHNGEINTVKTNRNAVYAYSRSMDPLPPGGNICTPQMSDSASLDEWTEHLVLEKNWSLERAIRLTIPPAWEGEPDIWGQEAVDLFTWGRRAMGSLCAWDGPAGLINTDGTMLIGQVDRMGLRPVRWCADQRGWLYIASESGVFGIETSTITASGQLQPGQMIVLDTSTGERLDSYQLMSRICAEVRAETELSLHETNRNQILVPESFDFASPIEDRVHYVMQKRNWTVDHLLQAHGWEFERAIFVKDMSKLKKEPLSSMGFDRVLTIFSLQHQTLFKYLQQTFAEVTNPPIDPYREGGAMSLVSYLGRSPLIVPKGEVLPCKQMELSTPVLSDAVVEEIRRQEILGFKSLSAVFPIEGGVESLKESLHRLRSEAERAVHEGFNVLCLSDKEAFEDGLVPIPSILALGAVHSYLSKQGLRGRCSLVVQAGDVQEGHDIACLVGFGADAVHPYLMLRLIRNGLTFKDGDTKQEWTLSAKECLENLFAALEDTFKKIIAKMGITTAEGYRGALLFEAVGFGQELMDFLGDLPSRIGGIGLKELVEDAKYRLARTENMQVLGRNRDYMAFNAKVRMALRKAAMAGSAANLPMSSAAGAKPPEALSDEGGESAYISAQAQVLANPISNEYTDFSKMVSDRTPTCLRDLFNLAEAENPLPIEEVQDGLDLIQNHLRGAAMSHGALTRASHQDIAAALNDLGGKSNSGEGGEARYRNDIPPKSEHEIWKTVRAERQQNLAGLTLNGDVNKSRLRSRIRQVASGRFGVDAEYLINGEEIQIKMAQGAKPGEGGQLMGKKVTSEIAEIRYGKPGNDLISPPPHHDIYSIEDLAQLIYDLKAVKPGIPVSVKLVAVDNIGTIAVGVAKAGADIIEIDGIGGGTGAAMVSSKEHCGLPSEMGLSEAHQALVVNGLRRKVILRVGGGIKNGVDVIKYALLGAQEFSLGQGLMVSVGCIVCKSCHIPNCPTGITGTQGEYKGEPEHTKAYLLGLAAEVRCLLAKLGARHISELCGRSELLIRRHNLPGRADLVDVHRFIAPDMALSRLEGHFPDAHVGVCSPGTDTMTLNQRIIHAGRDAIETANSADLVFKIKNSDRSVGATASGLIAQLYGREGMPHSRRLKVRFEGEAGQSFGAWNINSLELDLKGFAQDGVAKGISGGTVTVTLDYANTNLGDEILSVVGNNVGYGATGGQIFIGGCAGHRLGIRNSGATIVAEAAGKYACEYQTRGRVIILGPLENEIGSGMTGGELFVYDPHNTVSAKLHTRSVTVIDCTYVDYEWLHPMIIQYHAKTGSRSAESILKNWSEFRRGRRLRKIIPLAVARKAEDFIAAGSNAG
ncbi:MAG: hypothetical protein DWI28_01065 [Planctomycetota bacterium]|nr:glutamate synthase-related protein [Planctomycetota bacterium]RLT20558.1 MAG: hypothetical protein DWI28_01065 [Planctomycetota bacterium]RLT34445.1 MAG: hypothetical protein DWI59_06545 [Chloroflexota bacterium]